MDGGYPWEPEDCAFASHLPGPPVDAAFSAGTDPSSDSRSSMTTARQQVLDDAMLPVIHTIAGRVQQIAYGMQRRYC